MATVGVQRLGSTESTMTGIGHVVKPSGSTQEMGGAEFAQTQMPLEVRKGKPVNLSKQSTSGFPTFLPPKDRCITDKDLRNLLRDNLKRNPIANGRKMTMICGYEGEQNAADISRVQVNNVWEHQIGEKEEEIIAKRMQNQREMQEKFLEGQRARILTRFSHLTREEAIFALIECDHNEEEAIRLLHDHEYFSDVREKISKRLPARPGAALFHSDNAAGSDEDEDPEFAMARRAARRRVTSIREPRSYEPRQGKEPRERKPRPPRLLLNEALSSTSMEGWSEARKRAWELIDKNPNAYYYRFNAPNEPQANGAWTAKERQLFFERMHDVGVDGQWGIFSMTIPGRVGYQCSSYYRKLVDSGEIKDENYAIDADGKSHYIGKKGGLKKIKEQFGVADHLSPLKHRNTFVKRRKRKSEDDAAFGRQRKRPAPIDVSSAGKSDHDSEDSEPAPTHDGSNPIPEVIDKITLEPIVRPTISPYGHVLGLDTWVRCITLGVPKNMCPFTKQELHRRQLVPLTWENIEQYRDKMIV